MNRSTIDLWVGIFVTLGLGAIVFLALKVGNLTNVGSTPGYRIEAPSTTSAASSCRRR